MPSKKAKISINLTRDEARWLALASHGFGQNAPETAVATVDKLQVLQIDSVNVFERSHYMPAFSRLGSYDRTMLDEHLWGGTKYTEYWAHEAAFIAVADRHLFNWRMQDYEKRFKENGRLDKHRGDMQRLKQVLAERGPAFAKDLEQESRAGRGPWWDWSDTKRALEMLFATGEVVSAGRERFMRRYALAEWLPEEVRFETPRHFAQDELLQKAALSLGVATGHDLADYFRIKQGEANAAIKRLVAQGILLPAQVESWLDKRGEPLQTFVHRDTLQKIESEGIEKLYPNALLTPFDPLCWYRPRAERIFDFHYRIEIYTPKEKRKYGYYCLPLMIDGQLVGRLDLKADRKARALLVQAAWQEPDAPDHAAEVANSLLEEAAKWQGLERIEVSGAGNLALIR